MTIEDVLWYGFIYSILTGIILGVYSKYFVLEIDENINYLEKTYEMCGIRYIKIWHRLVEKTNSEASKYQTWKMNFTYFNADKKESFLIVLWICESRKYYASSLHNTNLIIKNKETKGNIPLHRTESYYNCSQDWGRKFVFSISRTSFEKLCLSENYVFIVKDFGGHGEQFYELANDKTKSFLTYLKRFHTRIERKSEKIKKITGSFKPLKQIT